MKRLLKIAKLILIFIYNLSGTRHIWENIIWPRENPTNKAKPSTVIIWIIGVYVGLFSIASQRYENRVDLIEVRIGSIFNQLSTPVYKRSFSRIYETQQLRCPLKPDFKNPTTVFQSLFYDSVYIEGVELLKAAVENWKDSLNNAPLRRANLSYANLSYVNFSRANFRDTDLSYANLSYANLIGANLRGAYLIGANLSSAYLMGADLSSAILEGTDLHDANLTNANLSSADLMHADLRGAILKSANLSSANLMGADLMGADLSHVQFLHTKNIMKDQLKGSYYLKGSKPKHIPEGINPPHQVENKPK